MIAVYIRCLLAWLCLDLLSAAQSAPAPEDCQSLPCNLIELDHEKALGTARERAQNLRTKWLRIFLNKWCLETNARCSSLLGGLKIL